METINHTPFPAQVFESIDQHGQVSYVATLRQTFALVAGELVFSDHQLPLAEGISHFQERVSGSVRQESDYCPFKPHCDVLINATAHAPRSAELQRFVVRLRVTRPGIARSLPERPRGLSPHMSPDPAVLAVWRQEVNRLNSLPDPLEILIDKTLAITGRRHFIKKPRWVRLLHAVVWIAALSTIRFNPWRLSRPTPLRSLPLLHEYAYGGECRMNAGTRATPSLPARYHLTAAQIAAHPDASSDQAPLAHCVDENNPYGTGFATHWYVRAMRLQQVLAPQIEATSQQMSALQFWKMQYSYELNPLDRTNWSDPIGLVARPNTHPTRRALAGTMDDAFINGTAALPTDFSEAYWNCAPRDQQIPYLRGDERVELTNLCSPDTPGAIIDAHGNTVLHFTLPKQSTFLLLRQYDGVLATMNLQADTVIVEPEQGIVALVWRVRWPKTSTSTLRVCEFRARIGTNRASSVASSDAQDSSLSTMQHPANA